MTPFAPYTFIRCPCSDQEATDPTTPSSPGIEAEQEEGTFDPQSPRSDFGLYPLEYLLYCEDCQQIRCPRCISEEIVAFYCPQCLFEVPSSNLRSEGNRCTRSCFQCPICVAPLQVTPLHQPGDATSASLAGPMAADGSQSAPASGPFVLYCPYCNWSSQEVGIDFDRSNGISAQLAKLKNGGAPKMTFKELREWRRENPDDAPLPDYRLDRELQFACLNSFYQDQLADVNIPLAGLSLTGSTRFSSPATLSRLMSLYTGRAHPEKQPKSPLDVMREALTTEEGLKLEELDQSAAIKKLTLGGWDQTASRDQVHNQLETARFVDELRPIPTLLRTKRSKRCPICRHIISKPESKVTSTRFKIRLVAKSYIPSISIRSLHQPAGPTLASSTTPLVSTPDTPRPHEDATSFLEPLKPHQFVLTVKNPLFDPIKVTLATPSTTPGRIATKVTVLCPQFEVDANTDMWNDALRDDDVKDPNSKTGDDGPGQVEAGKIWARGRNWVSTVVEVIPASISPADPAGTTDRGPEAATNGRKPVLTLEIPMFVRIEWEADAQVDVGATSGRDKEAREKRELAYWCVLGVGRLSNG